MNIQLGLEPIHGIYNLEKEEWEDGLETVTNAQWLAMLRTVRDGLLTKSDWTQTADSPLSGSKKTEWATYRQSLRDLPENATLGMVVEFPDEPAK
jgi:hypothetical protein